MQQSTYNGWSNRETWLAHAWLTNDIQSAELLREAKAEASEPSEQGQWLCDRYEAALHATLNYDNAFGEASLLRDLITGAFECINWTEIVQHG